MAKAPAQFNLPTVTIDRAAALPIADQLYRGIARAILEGSLKPTTRLPSTRILAAEFELARNTVSAAFDRLIAEGYVETRVGSGARVSATLPDNLRIAQRVHPIADGGVGPRFGFSRRGNLLARTQTSVTQGGGPRMTLSHGVPAFDLFPIRLWRRMVAERLSSRSHRMLGYGDPAGYRPLREAIAAYIGEARAVRATAERVMIVSGSQQALDLAARMLLDPGDRVIVEDPGYRGARAALTAAGARILALGIDGEGITIESAPAARAAYVTPSHQFPMGPTMSLGRRLALLKWAHDSRAWIFEDDYDSEYRYSGRPLAALQGIDGEGRVIYIGTFSKVMFPALRLGFLIVPEHLREGFAAAIALTARHPPTIEQAALADFIAGGHFARHVRRMRIEYARRRDALLDAAARHLRGLLEIVPTQAGMHCVGLLPEGIDDAEVSRVAALERIGVAPLSAYYAASPRRGGLLLGYAATGPAQIEDSMRRLGKIIVNARRSERHFESARSDKVAAADGA